MKLQDQVANVDFNEAMSRISVTYDRKQKLELDREQTISNYHCHCIKVDSWNDFLWYKWG